MTKQTRSQDKLSGNKISDSSSLNDVNLTQIGALMSSIVQERTKFLEEQVKLLQEQVAVLTESNKDLIRLLTRDNVYSNETHPEDVLNASGVSVSMNDTVIDAKDASKPYKKFTPKNKNKLTKSNEGNKTTTQHVPEITKKHNFAKSKSVIGKCNGELSSEPEFKAAAQRIWLHVSRVESGTRKEKIMAYLQRKCPGKDFVIEELSSDTGRSSTFKLGPDYELKDILYSGEFWPQGVMIRRFNFFRGHSKSTNNPFE
ncbi:hypothetical protein Zmor_019169 [Zophobas morio]|uniref:Uncharacterized protein n=1 Tax=Zophobas morio TaxID=2755281 RepID=A0AA38I0U0_9CUCU|nr:hypothetical protein Zmor_019169 [Zophobas morio]